ncbi:Hypothetical predicted protein [Lynx pardinus]|uniref:Uncharacterized protein n=1 Tax=Lynx pardinus TaxID=191816 RepID=A0A485NWM3_LYNPA|nr:Hypothetical predicted protein [Lynx pardinus]
MRWLLNAKYPVSSAHYSPELLGSSDPPASASRVAGTTGARHRARRSESLQRSTRGCGRMTLSGGGAGAGLREWIRPVRGGPEAEVV